MEGPGVMGEDSQASSDCLNSAGTLTSILDDICIQLISYDQVLLDALHHGYVSMGIDIGLIVFDEAHHVADKHPYNLIMKGFYFSLPPRSNLRAHQGAIERPAILGLTASPTFGVDIERAFR
jgi:endoribonuclease Dicer